MILKIIGRIFATVISIVLAWVWAVQFSGLTAAIIQSLNNTESTSVMIRNVTIVVAVFAVILIWSGVLGFSSIGKIKATSISISLYFITLIAITIGYMAVWGEIKYVMLGEVAGAWVIWFVILSALSNLRKRFEDAEKVEVPDSSESSDNKENQ